MRLDQVLDRVIDNGPMNEVATLVHTIEVERIVLLTAGGQNWRGTTMVRKLDRLYGGG